MDLATVIAELQRRLEAVERGSQLPDSSLDTDDGTVDLAVVVVDSQAAAAAALAQVADFEARLDGKVTTFYQDTEPTVDGDGVTFGDFWVTTAGDSCTFDGEAWLPVTSDAVREALQVAGDAQATADGKVESFYQDTAPTTAGIGDLWFDTVHGDQAHRFDGLTWVPLSVGSEALLPEAVQSVHIAPVAVQRVHVAAEAIGPVQIAPAAVQTVHVDTQAIESVHIAPAAVQAVHVDTQAITADKIADFNIPATKLNTVKHFIY